MQNERNHLSRVPIFCNRPQTGEKPLDALGGIQFQVPDPKDDDLVTVK